MGFVSVQTYQFRNLIPDKIITDAPIIYLVGRNGQGKTNFLESIYLLSFGSSFRTNNNDLLIAEGEREMSLFGEYLETEGDSIDVGVRIQKGKKDIKVNGKIIKDRKELIKNIPCIIFAHEDINFVKGSPEDKRFFFNQTMSLLNPSFVDVLRRYNKILKMRNLEIKRGHYANLDIYDTQLAEFGLVIQEERARIIDDFNITFNEVYRKISGDSEDFDNALVQIRYTPSWKEMDSKEQVIRHLAEKHYADKEMGFTTSGPHRDRFIFRKNGKNFSLTASTGQFRLAALTIRAAQAIFCTRNSSRRPILLLDDVLLELDGIKKQAFLQALPEYEQAFFTFLPEEEHSRFYPDRDILIYSVEEGKLRREESG